MSKKIVDKWKSAARKALVGRRIVGVDYLTAEETGEMMWSNSAVVLILDDGTALYPMSDDEGNDAGALATNKKELPVIPVIRR